MYTHVSKCKNDTSWKNNTNNNNKTPQSNHYFLPVKQTESSWRKTSGMDWSQGLSVSTREDLI
jgi:hypothetical protein